MSATLTIRLNDEKKNQLEMLANSTKRTKSWLAAQAVSEYLSRETAFIGHVKKALEEASQPDAVFIPHEDVEAWLDTWRTDRETPFPWK